MKDTWINMLKHMCNIHFDCNHTSLENLQRADWFHPTDPDFAVVREMVLDKKLLNSFQFYTKFRHTGELEVFHNHLLMYIPKRIFFNVLPKHNMLGLQLCSLLPKVHVST
eukprot:Seg2446.2 transcript_id=Seg2446.2/GoldUCD/mRNA.D3Y31 product="P2X purinoceptor 7" protein_id=Seg2446.2/GoldUCD/D3Y31